MSTFPEAKNIIGEPENRAKWVPRIMQTYNFTEKQANEVYDGALEHQKTRYRFPKFVEALDAEAGRLDGIYSMPSPKNGKTDWRG